MKKHVVLLSVVVVFLASGFAIFRIGSAAPASSRTGVSYSHDIRPILENRCGTCHMGKFVSGGLTMDTYESLMAGSQDGPVVLPHDANGSLIVQKLVEGKMPKSGPKLTPAQIQLIIEWIDAGAPNN